MELLKALQLLSDKGRVRVLRLLSQEELSVAELQDILGIGQSSISMQLAQLKQGGFVDVTRSGQKNFYRSAVPPDTQAILCEVLRRSHEEIPEAARDDEGLRLVLDRRKDRLRAHFDELAGRFGRDYVPGRSWQAFSEMLVRLLPPMVVADLGAGEGTLALLLAQRSERVIAVDNAQKMVEYGRSLAERNGIGNVDFLQGDLEEVPIESRAVDLAMMHQSLHHALHPQRALDEAWRILRPGGRIVVLDLLKHDVEAARELYADVWLGFTQVELIEMLQQAGFGRADVSVVHREPEPPHFQTVLAVAEK